MPVWHEFTREWRESGDLLVLGIVQEQHPERAALYAQWQGFEWPILWDPFNLTQSKAVPNLWAIDEHGVVRLERPSLETFEAEFLARAFDAPPTPAEPQRPESPGAGDGRERALSIALAGDASQLGGVIEVLTDQLAGEPGQAVAPRASFELGVALRLRHDSPAAQPGDFQAALDAWSRALAGDPAQYIWRRRLQQYGPRLDKPYPFYDWVEAAGVELRARGIEPIALGAALTGSERAGRGPAPSLGPAGLEPDAQDRVPRAGAGDLLWEQALVFDTSPPGPGGTARRDTARVHLTFRPARERGVHWNNSGEAPLMWVDVPAGWRIDQRRIERALPETETSDEARVFDFEVAAPGEGAARRATFKGYLLFGACSDDDGRCSWLRHDFEFEVELPGS